MTEDDFIDVALPKKLVDNAKKIVEQYNGLFEDEVDYITHCIIDNNFKFRK